MLNIKYSFDDFSVYIGKQGGNCPLRVSSVNRLSKSRLKVQEWFLHTCLIYKKGEIVFLFIYLKQSQKLGSISLALKIIIERFEGKTIFFKQMYLVRPFQSFLEEGA
jgi:hypothetical protein